VRRTLPEQWSVSSGIIGVYRDGTFEANKAGMLSSLITSLTGSAGLGLELLLVADLGTAVGLHFFSVRPTRYSCEGCLEARFRPTFALNKTHPTIEGREHFRANRSITKQRAVIDTVVS